MPQSGKVRGLFAVKYLLFVVIFKQPEHHPGRTAACDAATQRNDISRHTTNHTTPS